MPVVKKFLNLFFLLFFFCLVAHFTAQKSDAHIFGTVWYDNNYNGAQDSGESGVPNVKVIMTTTDGKNTYTTTTDSSGNYNDSNIVWSTYNVSIAVPAGYQSTTPNPVTNIVVNSTNGVQASFGIAVPQSTPTPTPTPAPCSVSTYGISGKLFVDANGNGKYDTGDSLYSGSGQTLTISGCSQNITVPISGGSYSAINLPNGTYTVTYNGPPTGYYTSYPSPSSFTATVGPNCSVVSNDASCSNGSITNLNFGLSNVAPCSTAAYTVSGKLFIDANSDGYYNGTDTLYTGTGQTVTLTGCSQTVVLPVSNGSYSSALLPYGNYTATYNGPPTGYYMSYPRTTVPPSFSFTIGPSCTVSTNDASCSSGNVINLNFGLTNVASWVQSVCGDFRQGSGITDMIPASPSCGSYSGAYLNQTDTNYCPTTPGIAFTGNTAASFGQGQAAASPNNWIVGGTTNPETYTPASPQTIHTSYSHMQAQLRDSGTTATDLSTVCTLSNCTLPATLANGVYQANGNVTLNAFTFPSNKNYIFVINGDLTIIGNISLPVGSTALFSASGNIYIDKSIGVTSTSTTSNLDGFYSADKSFIVNSYGSCSDQRLNIFGSVVVNAALGGGR